MKKTTNIFITLLLFISVCCTGQKKYQLVIAQNGKTNYRIVIPANATQIENKAGQELQKYLNLVCGATFNIVNDNQKPLPCEILVGKTNRTSKIDYTNLSEDGIAIKTEPNQLFITGGTKKGILYSVYTFLEDYLNCRKYTKEAIVIPKQNNIILSPINKVENPTFKFRSAHYLDAFDQEYCDWNKLNLPFENWGSFAHTFGVLLPAKEYFSQHPEYFALVNGKRVPDQPCLSNPDVYNIMLKNLKKEMASNPNATIWSVSHNDNLNYCHCALCEPINKAEGGFQGNLIRFVNKVATQCPDKVISTLAYNQSFNPPTTVTPISNVLIMFCVTVNNKGVPLQTAFDDKSISMRNALIGWTKKTKNLFIWDYIVQFSNSLSPYPNIPTISNNLKYYNSLGINKIFEQGIGWQLGEFSELKTYLVANLTWDINVRQDKIAADFINGYYGKAAGKMKEYLALLQSEYNKSNLPLNMYGSPVDAKNSYLSTGNLNKYINILTAAQDSVKDDHTILKRVTKEKLSVVYAQLEIAKTAPDKKLMNSNFSRINSLLKTFQADCKMVGITKLGEGGLTPDKYVSQY